MLILEKFKRKTINSMNFVTKFKRIRINPMHMQRSLGAGVTKIRNSNENEKEIN
jgi:hypothetical protein